MKVVLAEKPSVARDLAAFLGAKQRRDGYLEGNGYVVTWAFGHLVTLKEPDDYDPALKRWSLADLPIVPERFELKLTGDDGAKKQFETIAKQFREADEIVCATDAGREGELIFRYILELAACLDKPVRRLWLSSLTEQAIATAFDQLRPGAEFDSLYAAARCRSEADWIVGMNATRNYTVRFGQSGVLWSVGRVQTPVLALIAERDEEIRHFKPEPWFELRTKYRDVVFKYRGDRFEQAREAQDAAASIRGREFEVTGTKVRDEKVQPPQLFDLTALQRDMNQRYGYSAQDTLKCVQALYERKLVTYPRTDSRYLTKDMVSEVERVLGVARKVYGERAERLPDEVKPHKRVFDDNKVEDHHAIIPTGNAPGGLDDRHLRVFHAIFLRLVAAFYPPCHKQITTVDGKVDAFAFRASGVRILDPGWTTVHPPERRAKAKDDDEEQVMPGFEKGERGPHEPEVKEGETKPPRHYTENSLLGAMETAGKLVDDEELKEALKARGLGTPATRANIIETLLRRRFIERDKKALRVTDLGRFLIALIQDPILKSAEMTGEWESRLKDVEGGKLDAATFMGSIREFTERVIDGSAQSRLDHERIGTCPKCNAPIIEGRRGFGCSGFKAGCDYVLWKEFRDATIGLEQARELLQRGVSLRPIRVGDQAMHLYLTKRGVVDAVPVPQREHQRSAPKRKPARATKSTASGTKKASGTSKGRSKAQAAACPLCGGGMLEREKSYSCANWKSGCSFTIWKEIAGKKITKAMAKKLVTKGQTQVLKGFTSKAGKKFDAKLQIEDGKVRFEFG